MNGPGKYDDVCTQAREATEATEAASVVLIVFGGKHGHGFSVQSSTADLLLLPQILRSIADQIDNDMGHV
jgi:hypothetical protein